ncbi:DUF2255 family protein [Isoptericola halotolerans]|uniref:DUF2255 family protein n=1 Tax=Isoptericola halotolerans TaxID=300560 RepID=UPI00388FAE00
MPSTSIDALASAPVAQLLTSDGPGPGAPAWVVSLGHELYVRSAPGLGGTWPGGGRARVRVAGAEHPVTLAEVAPEVHDLLDDAYRATYGRCGPDKVSALVSDGAAAATFRLSPRRATLWERTVPLLDAAESWWRRLRAPATDRTSEALCPSC